MSRRPQLDAIRGIAAVLVVVHHWTTWGSVVNFGNVGVQLFFVLSGFLITGILLDQGRYLEGHKTSYWLILKTFFERRAARIWPVMFLTLTFVWFAGDRFERREDILWHAMFGSNILFFLRGEFGSTLAHFWSLAVEQQFYLFWPFIVLFVPRRWLETTILTLVVIAPLTRLVLVSQGYTSFAQYNVLPFANLDSLGMGALVALWLRLRPSSAGQRWRLLQYASGASMAGLMILAFGSASANLAQTFYAISFASIIAAAHRGIGGIAGLILKSPVLVSLGTISYGIYVYHVFAPRAVEMALRAFNAPMVMHSDVPLFVLSASVTLLIATLSWWLMERPVLALGHRPDASLPTDLPIVRLKSGSS